MRHYEDKASRLDAPAATIAKASAQTRDSGIARGMSIRALKCSPETDSEISTLPSPLQLLQQFLVTDEKVKHMQATELIWRDVIAKGHVSVWAAPGNGGKTSLALFAASELAGDGFEVHYFQEDAGAGDLPNLQSHAAQHGYKLYCSTLASSAPADQIQVLELMIQVQTQLDGHVFFFDTLKKYLDLMSKGQSREFFRLTRSLTTLGATVILLGHTNKNPTHDGNQVFEGVGDVRNDVDELFYLIRSEKDSADKVMLGIKPDKVRCAVKEQTFELDTTTREVRHLPTRMDVAKLGDLQRRREQDTPAIEVIDQHLEATGGANLTELVELVHETLGISNAKARNLIYFHSSTEADDANALWVRTHLQINNAVRVSAKPKAV